MVEDENSREVESSLPGTAQPKLGGAERSRLKIALPLAILVLLLVVGAYLLITAIPNGGGSP